MRESVTVANTLAVHPRDQFVPVNAKINQFMPKTGWTEKDIE